MQRFHHRRGNSQQINRSSRGREKDPLDLKQNYAFSSQHTRSTAFTLHKNRDKDHNLLKEKDKSRPDTSKDKKKKFQLNNSQKIVWKQEQAPYTSNEILKLYYKFLEPYERNEVKQYQNIYYIGSKCKEIWPPKYVKQLNENEQQGFLKYRIGDHIAYRYQIMEKINRGSFGQVLKVYDHKSKQFQALKIVKKMPDLVKQTFVQISILTSIKEKDKSDMSGIVRIKDFTIFRQHICISFELMDANLYELLHANQFKGLNESFVRIFAIQILNSLNFLYRNNIVHCDIKPENFVLKSWGKSGIKLIDFGTSCYEDQQTYTYIQSRYYRAPQVIFQKRYTASIDMWSFGCMIAELSLGKPLFPGNSDLHQLIYFVNLLGYPEAEYSRRCKLQIQRIRQNRYLEKDCMGKINKENLEKFYKDTGYKLDEENLKPLQERWEGDMFPFVHFLKQILKWDPNDRITPAEALQHPWVTSGLPNEIRQLYTVYQNIDKISPVPQPNKQKKAKSKNKSKSRQKSRQKHSPISKCPTKQMYTSINFNKRNSKMLKFDLPQSLLSKKSQTSKNSQQKSRNQKSNKSPYANKKFKL